MKVANFLRFFRTFSQNVDLESNILKNCNFNDKHNFGKSKCDSTK